jgi:hypothetical protein
LIDKRKAGHLFLISFLAILMVPAATARSRKVISETIEWTWEVKPEHPQAELPNVLLVGDSITRNYFSSVRQTLEGKANVYLFATSASAGDPRLPAQLAEFFAMEDVPFQVIHFNNGMHGWGYSEIQYRDGINDLIRTLKAKAPNAFLIWASTTPVRKDNPDGANNARVKARDDLAQEIMSRNHIAIDDQFTIVLNAPDGYSDDVHPSEKTSELQGRQAARMIAGHLH